MSTRQNRLGRSIAAVALLGSVAMLAGARGKREPPPDQPPPPVQQPEPPPEPKKAAPILDLFPDTLPLDPGPVPAGLASMSAQSCNGCHYSAHDGWKSSAHAVGHASASFVKAVREAGTPMCTVCHQALVTQQTDLVAYDGDTQHPRTEPNPRFDPTLSTEGVTCATCHVRDGVVIAAEPVTKAPHPTGYSPELTSSELCAACHQLTWPGADQPIYDTYGEWSRSAYAAAEIRCQDCHMAAGADARLGSDHRSAADPARAVTVLVDVDHVDVVRGGPPIEVAIRILNTGAGHTFPTGTPWRGVRVQAALVGPLGKGGSPAPYKGSFTADLQRTIEPTAPWRTTADNRIPAGGEANFDWRASLPAEVPAGDWQLVVTLTETTAGQASATAFVEQRIPLRVDGWTR